MNERFTKEIDIFKRNQIEILELKNSLKEIQNTFESPNNGLDQAEERISATETRLEAVQPHCSGEEGGLA